MSPMWSSGGFEFVKSPLTHRVTISSFASYIFIIYLTSATVAANQALGLLPVVVS